MTWKPISESRRGSADRLLSRIMAAFLLAVFLHCAAFVFSSPAKTSLPARENGKNVYMLPLIPDDHLAGRYASFIKYGDPSLMVVPNPVHGFSNVLQKEGMRTAVPDIYSSPSVMMPPLHALDILPLSAEISKRNGQDMLFSGLSKYFSLSDPGTAAIPKAALSYPAVFDSSGNAIPGILSRIMLRHDLNAAAAKEAQTVYDVAIRGDDRLPRLEMISSSSDAALDKAAAMAIASFISGKEYRGPARQMRIFVVWRK